MSSGARELVVFMIHVNRNERGLMSSGLPLDWPFVPRPGLAGGGGSEDTVDKVVFAGGLISVPPPLIGGCPGIIIPGVLHRNHIGLLIQCASS